MASLAYNVHFVLVRGSYLGRVLGIKDSGQHVPLDALAGSSACGSAAASSCCAGAGAGAGGACHFLAGCAVRTRVVAVGSSRSFWRQGGAVGVVVSVALALASEYY